MGATPSLCSHACVYEVRRCMPASFPFVPRGCTKGRYTVAESPATRTAPPRRACNLRNRARRYWCHPSLAAPPFARRSVRRQFALGLDKRAQWCWWPGGQAHGSVCKACQAVLSALWQRLPKLATFFPLGSEISSCAEVTFAGVAATRVYVPCAIRRSATRCTPHSSGACSHLRGWSCSHQPRRP